MSLMARIYDEEAAPEGHALSDAPDGFLSQVVAHARKAPHRFPLLSAIDPAFPTTIDSGQRERLKKEWVLMESLAIGPHEKAKWYAVYSALIRLQTFMGIQFLDH